MLPQREEGGLSTARKPPGGLSRSAHFGGNARAVVSPMQLHACSAGCLSSVLRPPTGPVLVGHDHASGVVLRCKADWTWPLRGNSSSQPTSTNSAQSVVYLGDRRSCFICQAPTPSRHMGATVAPSRIASLPNRS